MPKMKTHKGTKKRIKLTSKGKAKYRHAGKRHLLSHKSGKRKRRLGKADIVDKSEESRIKKLLPYGG